MLQKVPTGENVSVVVPTTLKDLAKQHRRMSTLMGHINGLKEKLARKIKNLKEESAKKSDPLRLELLALAVGVFQFAQKHKAELLSGDSKGYDLPHGGSLEWEEQKKNPPLLFDEKKEDEAVAKLEKLGLRDCVSYNPTVNRTKVKEILRNEKTDPKIRRELEKIFSLDEDTIFRIKFAGLKTRVQCKVSTGEFDVVEPRSTKAASTATIS